MASTRVSKRLGLGTRVHGPTRSMAAAIMGSASLKEVIAVATISGHVATAMGGVSKDGTAECSGLISVIKFLITPMPMPTLFRGLAYLQSGSCKRLVLRIA